MNVYNIEAREISLHHLTYYHISTDLIKSVNLHELDFFP